ncbi:MAG: hypothetical protein K0R38_4179 [Polyangiaceae bacterium]|jgi:hypothetical protein|nr:hypothetical protein [Polyangiaceae bacterium]
MRKQQLAMRAFWLVTAVGIGSVYAGDGPASAKSTAKAAAGEARHDKNEHGAPGQKHDHGKPESNPEPAGKDADRGKVGDKGKGEDKDKGPEGRRAAGHGMRDVWMELKSGKLKKGEVKERLSDLREHRSERAQKHREELQARFGAALGGPAAREELERHARRTAKLNQAMIVAETEVTKDKDKVKERIGKLIDKENARHQLAMARFQSKAPGAAAAASGAPKAPPAVVASDKGDVK